MPVQTCGSVFLNSGGEMKKFPETKFSEIDGADRMMITGFVLGTLVFLATIGHTPYFLSWVVKTLPIACLALVAFRHFPGRAGWGMGLGFVFSGIGDILLELPRTAILFQAGMGAFIVFLFPRLGDMALPILVYFSVILAMAVSTCLGRDNHWTAMAGAFLFILSDSLIALNMFVFPVPASDFWIMVTYYPAQALLAAGVWYSIGRQKTTATNPQFG